VAAIRAALAAVCAALAVSGCAPLEIHASSRRPAPLARAQATHEYPAAPAPAPSVADGGATSPLAAIQAFATTYINWNAGTIATQLRALAADSVGQARSAMMLAAAQTADDYELQHGGVQNSGTVEAVAPLVGQANQYVVVTREQTSATNTSAYAGLAPSWHLTLATVVEVSRGRWALNGWQPES
jgi:hypothetical protein